MNWKSIKERHDLLSLLVAAIAVLLSQFPPVYQWFYSPDIEIGKSESFVLFPSVYTGLAISKYYSATNTGEEPGRVKNISLFFTDGEHNVLHKVSSQGYRLHGTGQFGQSQWEQFTELSLKPGENWSHLVSFNRRLKNFELDSLRYIQDEIQSEREEWKWKMEEQGWNLEKYDPDMPEFKISDELLEKLKLEVNKKISWLKEGEYILHEISYTDEKHEINSYSFEINKNHLVNFALSIDSYAYGLDSSLPSVIFELKGIEAKISKELQKVIDEYNN